MGSQLSKLTPLKVLTLLVEKGLTVGLATMALLLVKAAIVNRTVSGQAGMS